MVKLSLNLLEKLELLLKKLPDGITGNTQIMKGKYIAAHGEKDCERIIQKAKVENLKSYMIIITILIISIIAVPAYYFFGDKVILKDRKMLEYIERPDEKSSDKVATVKVKANYKGLEIDQSMNLNIKAKQRTAVEEKKLLKEYGRQLEGIMLGENTALDKVEYPLHLPEMDGVWGITMAWYSDNEKIIDTTGNVDLIYAAENSKERDLNLELKCQLSLGDAVIEETFPVKIKLPKEIAHYEPSLHKRLNELEKSLSGSQGIGGLRLPESMGEDIGLQWGEVRDLSSGGMIIFCLMLILLVYKNRYRKLEKKISSVRESMSDDFPELINKMVLLLNAGLVVTSAISSITQGYRVRKKEDGNIKEGRPLYEELCDIERRVRETNAPIGAELKDFARRSGVKEILRFSAIVDENMNKGTVLVEKLQIEGEMLWLNRKKRAEEKGRLAETKLTFPLMILLLVLMVLTVSPTFLEM